MRATCLALRVREDGLYMGGPPCGPWIFINSGTHLRTLKNIWGDLSKDYVKKSNKFFGFSVSIFWGGRIICVVENSSSQFHSPIAICLHLRLTARWALLLLLGAVRCVATLTEQPGGSIMRHFPYIQHLQKVIADVLGGSWESTYLP